MWHRVFSVTNLKFHTYSDLVVFITAFGMFDICVVAPLALLFGCVCCSHGDVIKWKHLPRYWPFVRGIHRSPVNSPHKVQWRGALMFLWYRGSITFLLYVGPSLGISVYISVNVCIYWPGHEGGLVFLPGLLSFDESLLYWSAGSFVVLIYRICWWRKLKG